MKWTWIPLQHFELILLDNAGPVALVCPVLSMGTFGICVEACTRGGCPEGQLCCSNGCGHICQKGELYPCSLVVQVTMGEQAKLCQHTMFPHHPSLIFNASIHCLEGDTQLGTLDIWVSVNLTFSLILNKNMICPRMHPALFLLQYTMM